MKVALRLLAVIVLAASPLSAQSFTSGDLVVSGITPRGGSVGIEWYQRLLLLDPQGASKATLLSNGPFRIFPVDLHSLDVGFDSTGRLHAAASRVFRIAPDGSIIAQSIHSPDRLAFAANGHIFTLHTANRTVIELDSDLRQVRSIALEPLAVSIDLAPDQCSLYYAAQFPPRIGGVNLCTSTAIPTVNLPEPPNYAIGSLRLIDGGFLYGGTRGVMRIDSAGNVLHFYPGFYFALDPDRKSFWTWQGSSLYKINIQDGAVLRGPIDIGDRLEEIRTIAVAGEPRAALAPANTPAISHAGLLCLSVCLAAVGMVTLRQHLL